MHKVIDKLDLREICGLKWDDIDRNMRITYVRRQLVVKKRDTEYSIRKWLLKMGVILVLLGILALILIH